MEKKKRQMDESIPGFASKYTIEPSCLTRNVGTGSHTRQRSD